MAEDHLSPSSSIWLKSLKDELEPTESDLARLRTTVLTSVGTGAALGAAKASAWAGLPLLAKGSIIASVVVASAFGGYQLTRSRPEERQPRAAVSASIPASSESPPVSGTPTIDVTETAEAVPSERPARRVLAPADESVSSETELLSVAEAALRRNDLGLVLRLTREHRRRFAHGALVEERDSLQAIARCRQSSVLARAEVSQRFVAEHPNALARSRVERECGP